MPAFVILILVIGVIGCTMFFIWLSFRDHSKPLWCETFVNNYFRSSLPNESRSATLSREVQRSEGFSNSTNGIQSVDCARSHQSAPLITTYMPKPPPLGFNSSDIYNPEINSSADSVPNIGFSVSTLVGPPKRAPYPTEPEIYGNEYPMPTPRSNSFSSPNRAPYPADSDVEISSYRNPTTNTGFDAFKNKTPYPTGSEIGGSTYPMPTKRIAPYPPDSEIEDRPCSLSSMRTDSSSSTIRAPYPTGSEIERLPYSTPTAPYPAGSESDRRTTSKSKAPYPETTSYFFPLPTTAPRSERTHSRIETSSETNILHPAPITSHSTEAPPPSYSDAVGKHK